MGLLATIAAVSKRMPKLACLALAAAALFAAGCGGGDDPNPSISEASATTLLGTLQEVQDNVDVGSCTVATEKVQELQGEISQLPSDVDPDVSEALDRGSQNLLSLIDEQCERPEQTTTEETTTEETTTEEPTEETTTEAPPTTTTTPPPTSGGGSGGVGPGGDGL